MIVDRPIVLHEQADLRGLGRNAGIARTKIDFERLGEIDILFFVDAELELGIGERTAAPDLIFLKR